MGTAERRERRVEREYWQRLLFQLDMRRLFRLKPVAAAVRRALAEMERS